MAERVVVFFERGPFSAVWNVRLAFSQEESQASTSKCTPTPPPSIPHGQDRQRARLRSLSLGVGPRRPRRPPDQPRPAAAARAAGPRDGAGAPQPAGPGRAQWLRGAVGLLHPCLPGCQSFPRPLWASQGPATAPHSWARRGGGQYGAGAAAARPAIPIRLQPVLGRTRGRLLGTFIRGKLTGTGSQASCHARHYGQLLVFLACKAHCSGKCHL